MTCHSTEPARFPDNFPTDDQYITRAMEELNFSRRKLGLPRVAFYQLGLKDSASVLASAQAYKQRDLKDQLGALERKHPVLARISTAITWLFGPPKGRAL